MADKTLGQILFETEEVMSYHAVVEAAWALIAWRAFEPRWAERLDALRSAVEALAALEEKP